MNASTSRRIAWILLMFGLVSVQAHAQSQAVLGDRRGATISPELQQVIGTGEDVAFIIRFRQLVNLYQFNTLGQNRAPGRAAQIGALRGAADSAQGAAAGILTRGGATRQIQLWSINALATTANADLIPQLARLPEVSSITADLPVEQFMPQSYGSTTPAEWNLETIRAPEFWEENHTGQGMVVANLDSGVDPMHQDLATRWRGGSNSWFDPHGEHPTPYDSTGHGTAVMSLAVGGNAGGTSIGVAPGAQWIAVKLFPDAGAPTVSEIHLSFQWLLDPDGNAVTDDAPHVVNNSWGYLDSQNPCNTEFEQDIATLKASGISVVFSAGNIGPSPGSSRSPANNPSGFAVGSVDINDAVDLSSSRGPSACGQPAYPHLVAPGVDVLAADLTFGGAFPASYQQFSGTSAAAPHVTGALALLREAHPDASVGALEYALKQSAVDLAAPGVDNDTGHGLIDIVEASEYLDEQSSSGNEDPVAANDLFAVLIDSSSNMLDVLANDTDYEGDPLGFTGQPGQQTAAGGRVLVIGGSAMNYTPPAGFEGTDSFSYEITDGQGYSSATVTVTVGPGSATAEEEFVLWRGPEIAEPAAGSRLAGREVMLRWLANSEIVDEWWVYAGAAPRAQDYFDSGALGRATDTTMTGLPADGSLVYITLYHRRDGGPWQSLVREYRAARAPELIAPGSGAVLAGTSETFSWIANEETVDEWWIYAGAAPYSRYYFDSGTLGRATTATITGLPVDGSLVYITLYHRRDGGAWRSLVREYRAARAAGMPELNSPDAGAVLDGARETFSWIANEETVDEWWLYIGDAQGSRRYHDSGTLGRSTTASVDGLPTDGSVVYVTLYYRQRDGLWKSLVQTYTAASP